MKDGITVLLSNYRPGSFKLGSLKRLRLAPRFIRRSILFVNPGQISSLVFQNAWLSTPRVIAAVTSSPNTNTQPSRGRFAYARARARRFSLPRGNSRDIARVRGRLSRGNDESARGQGRGPMLLKCRFKFEYLIGTLQTMDGTDLPSSLDFFGAFVSWAPLMLACLARFERRLQLANGLVY